MRIPILKNKALLACLLISPMLVQCIATDQDLKSLDLRLRTMDNRLINMDRGFKGLQEETTTRANKNSVEALQKRQAETDNNLDQLRTQLLQVKGQIEENSHHFRQLQEDIGEYRDSVSNRFHDLAEIINNQQTVQDEQQKNLEELRLAIEELTARLKVNREELDGIKKNLADEAARKAAEAAGKAALAARKAEKARVMAMASGRIPTISPDKKKVAIKRASETASQKNERSEPPAKRDKGKARSLYDSGITAFKDKKFQESYRIFNQFTKEFPSDKLLTDAQLWMSESLYEQGEYELAILGYQKVIDGPQHSKIPAALLKQALAFEKLNEKATARLLYEKLVNQYPDSREAKKARGKLK